MLRSTPRTAGTVSYTHLNPISRFWPKQRIKKQYAKTLQASGKVKKTAEATAKAAKKTAQETKRATFFVVRHWKGCLIVGGIAFILSLIHIIVQRLLIEKICVCLYRLFFRCRRCPVGFQLMAAYAALNCPRRHAARFLSGKFYPVPAFHTDVFFLSLVDFPMYGTV